MPTKANPTKDGYTFVGWQPSIVPATANATYTAVFEPIEVEEPTKDEINGAALDALIGESFYSLLPKIYSDEYEFFDESSNSYPVDIYIDLFDWEEEDFDAYATLMDDLFEYDFESDSYLVGEYYVILYLDTELYDVPVYGINIYTVA